MSTIATANSVLMGGGGAKSAKLTEGITVQGRILQVSEPYQEREYSPTDPGNGTPKFFKNGNPIMTFYVDVQTTEHDDEDDDGVRRVYMDGVRIKKAVRAGVANAGASGLQVGGTLAITCTHYDTPGDIRSGKNYSVTYAPGSAANGVLMGQDHTEQAPAPQQPQVPQAIPAQQPAPAPTAPAPAAGPTPEQIAALKAAGMDPAAIFPGLAS